MDTFSRKHRLRQLQLQKLQHQQQQLLVSDYLVCHKENSQPLQQQQKQQHFHHKYQHQSVANGAAIGRGGGGGGTMTRKCILRDNNEFEDDEFKVVRVIGFQEPISCDASRFPRQVSQKKEQTTQLEKSLKAAPISLVRYNQTTGGSTNDLISQQCLSDSSGFSSSLYSTQVEIKHHRSTTNTTISTSNQSKLIDELDRLIMHVDSATSPGESYMSCMDPRQDSTLVRSNERVNSSLCRDEFSSFIALNSDDKQSKVSPSFEDARRREIGYNHYSTISETELSCDSSEDSKCSNNYDSYQRCQNNFESLLEQHVAKVQTLLRLASGDRNVSMKEAFDQSDIPVSEEFRIPIKIEDATPKSTGRSIIHELEIVDLRDGENLLENVVRERFEGSQVGFICPLELQLDWSTNRTEQGKQVELSENISSLKVSILKKLLKNQEEALNECLVSKVSEHVNEFIDKYVEFHNNLRAYTTFSSDWHENWLFASANDSRGGRGRGTGKSVETEDEDEGQIASKRARLANKEFPCDLLRYSTLILNNSRLGRQRSLRYLTDQLLAGDSAKGELNKVDQYYREQEEQMIELRDCITNSCGLPDVCQLLLEEDYCCSIETSGKQPIAAGKLQVSYESSRLHAAGHLSFMAYGYSIKTPLLISPNTSLMKLAHLKQRILMRIEDSLKVPAPIAPSNHQVRFSISVTSVELVNRLQVIQFCAQVLGYLPISVRWFRGSQEISNRIQSTCEVGQTASEWPVWFHANYDYQYKTEWSSWYRFRRNRDRILFEIRCPDKERDYDVPYRCVIENYCSQAECNFSLKKRLLKHSPITCVTDLNNNNNKSADKIKNGSPEGASNNKARAVLRTWSQRTLKPQARVLEELADEEEIGKLQHSKQQLNILNKRSLNESLSLNEDKFGKEFPYHPENLLKRLRENMFSIGSNRKVAAHSTNVQSLENYSLPEQQIHFKPLEEPKYEREQHSTPPIANLCWSTQDETPISNGKDAPKPQDRLSKKTLINNQIQNHNQSCVISHETSEPNNSNRSQFMHNKFDNHKSKESKASSFQSVAGQTGMCRSETSPHADSNGNYKLKTCVKSLISKFNMT